MRLANVEWLLTALCEGPDNPRARIREAISVGARLDDVFRQAQVAPQLQLDPEGQSTSIQHNAFAAARDSRGVKPEDLSAAPNEWMGLDTNTDLSPYGSGLSLVGNHFP